MRELSPRLTERMNKLVNRVVQARLACDGRPFIIGHLITQRCMCNCRSCLWKHNDYEDVPFEDIRKFYAQAAEEGFLATAFSGGEPFQQPETLLDLLRRLCGPGRRRWGRGAAAR